MQPSAIHVSFTGGKDSVLALHLVKLNLNLAVHDLIVFVPADTSMPFKAHPVEFMRKQAYVLGIKLRECLVGGDVSFEASYRKHFEAFHEKEGIVEFITGDIEDVNDGFMEKAARGTGLKIMSPLFQMARARILELVESYKIKPLITLVSLAHIPLSIAHLILGRFLDQRVIEILNLHNASRVPALSINQRKERWNRFGSLAQFHDIAVDLCGENGEFHTMCMDCELFTQRLGFVDCVTGAEVAGDQIQRMKTTDGKYLYLDLSEIRVEAFPK